MRERELITRGRITNHLLWALPYLALLSAPTRLANHVGAFRIKHRQSTNFEEGPPD